jgi:hypothetical protein
MRVRVEEAFSGMRLGHATTLSLAGCFKIADEGLRHLGHVTTR